jgi:hypothetical protein
LAVRSSHPDNRLSLCQAANKTQASLQKLGMTMEEKKCNVFKENLAYERPFLLNWGFVVTMGDI